MSTTIQIVPQFNINEFENYFNISSSTVRNVFTTVFLVLNVIIMFVGGRLIKRQAQRKLLKGQTVHLPNLTPWLSLGSTLTYCWNLKTLPAGWFGLLMISSGAWSTINRYIVNSYIIDQPSSVNCEFGTGLLTTAWNASLKPASQWPAAQVAFSARDAANLNGGTQGVWPTVHANVSVFAPGPSDLLGFWNCQPAGQTTLQPIDWTNASTIVSFIDNDDSFYYTQVSGYAGSIIGNGPWTNLFLYSFNQFANSTKMWDMRASVITGLDGSQPMNTSDYQCHLNITNPTWTPTPIPAESTFLEWGQVFVGEFLAQDEAYWSTSIENTLNIMSVVAGSGNTLSYTSADAANMSAPTTYGCVLQTTVIFKQVFAFCFVLVIVIFLLGVVDLYDLFMNRADERNAAIEELPVDLLDWQLIMVRHMVGNNSLQRKDLTGYEYYWNEVSGIYACRPVVKMDAGQTYLPVVNPQNAMPSDSKTEVVVASSEVGNSSVEKVSL
ncbi:hypothetical protein G7Y89_g13936 [Cudoniella acicularis]|uniref:Uncharacterized protein n=1 Tax=Cudoniella acicularis TaxID=354080 RepID=A0A8H4VY72_9HELO|nr:hypothetical protein G7Y89_g13936 [Cudoniella acicularis]